jgi:hypothetical protein
MKLTELFAFLLSLQFTSSALAFVASSTGNKNRRVALKSMEGTTNEGADIACAGAHPFSALPGDPSLHIVTNVDLGDKKLDIMKGKTTS